MAKFRMVYTEFWSDPKTIEEMTPEDKYFFLYLLTNPNTKQIGIYQITKKQMAFDMGYSMETINALLDRFLKHHELITYNEDTREIAIKNWGRFNLQRGGKPMEDCVIAELKEVKDKTLINYVGKRVENAKLKALYDTYNDTSTTSPQYKEEEEEEDKEEEKYISRKQKPVYDNSHYQLAKLLYEKILENNPNHKKPNLDNWANDIRKTINIDKRSYKQVEYLINWVQQDDFWCSNVLSPAKLRKQFDQLVIVIKKEHKAAKELTSKSDKNASTIEALREGIANEQRAGIEHTRSDSNKLPQL
ncbi:MAG TPA: hypothetical protein VK094_00165 [Pseudogracilibacillus sp.]|nr:hypothetical protein [Pseudogracilibacillus sp.]